MIGIGYFIPVPNDVEKANREVCEMIDAAKDVLRKESERPARRTVSDETKRRQSASKKKFFRFLNPAGELVETYGLKELSEQFGLTCSELSRLHSGKIHRHHGWKKA